MSAPVEFRTIDDLERGVRDGKVTAPAAATMWSYISAWFLIIWIFWSIIVGSVLMYRFSHYFASNKDHQHSHYNRGSVDNTSYLSVFVVSIIIGLFLTVITMGMFSMFKKSEKKM